MKIPTLIQFVPFIISVPSNSQLDLKKKINLEIPRNP